jgi:8-oxo-dGTP diphosphatase
VKNLLDNSMAGRPLVGVSVFITRPGPSGVQVLLGLRIGSHGANTWCTPGGHLELGESFAECAARETEEETGLKILPEHAAVIATTNDLFPGEGRDADGNPALKHYITIVIRGILPEEEKNKEPKVILF